MRNIVRRSIILGLLTVPAARVLGQTAPAAPVANTYDSASTSDTGRHKSYLIPALELAGFGAAQRLRPVRVPQRSPRRQEGLQLDVGDDVGSPSDAALGARPGSIQRESVRSSVSRRLDVPDRAFEWPRVLDVARVFGRWQL